VNVNICILLIKQNTYSLGEGGRDCMVVGFTKRVNSHSDLLVIIKSYKICSFKGEISFNRQNTILIMELRYDLIDHFLYNALIGTTRIFPHL
jgi:hypothetical protein